MTESKEEKKQAQPPSIVSDIIIQSERIPKLKEVAVSESEEAAEAQYELACCYAWGIGVEMSPHHIEEARKWLQAASSNEYPDPFLLAALLKASDNADSASTFTLSGSSSPFVGGFSSITKTPITSIIVQSLNPSSPDLVTAINDYLQIAIKEGGETVLGKEAEAHLARLLSLFYQHNQFDLLRRCGEACKKQTFYSVQINALLSRLLKHSQSETLCGKEEYGLVIVWFAQYVLTPAADGSGFKAFNDVPSAEVIEAFKFAAGASCTSAQYALYQFFKNGRDAQVLKRYEVIRWLEEAAGLETEGVVTLMAINTLGNMFETDTDSGVVAAFPLYKKAAERGFLLAQGNLSRIYQEGEIESPNMGLAIEWGQRAAMQGGVAYQQYSLSCLMKKVGNWLEARRWLEKSAAQNCLDAIPELGWYHEQGKAGLAPNKEQARRYYKRAADEKNAVGQYRLACLLENDNPPNWREVKKLVEESAAQNYKEAIGALGWYHEHGKGGFAQNKDQARHYYQEAANRWSALAMYRLACLMEKDAPPNREKIMELYSRSAGEGNLDAKSKLGLKDEKGLPTDRKREEECCRQAAVQGNVPDQYRLGYLKEEDANLSTGSIKQELEREAIYWYWQASIAKHPLARKRLELLLEKILVRFKISSDTRDQNDRAVKAFIKNGPIQCILQEPKCVVPSALDHLLFQAVRDHHYHTVRVLVWCTEVDLTHRDESGDTFLLALLDGIERQIATPNPVYEIDNSPHNVVAFLFSQLDERGLSYLRHARRQLEKDKRNAHEMCKNIYGNRNITQLSWAKGFLQNLLTFYNYSNLPKDERCFAVKGAMLQVPSSVLPPELMNNSGILNIIFDYDHDNPIAPVASRATPAVLLASSLPSALGTAAPANEAKQQVNDPSKLQGTGQIPNK